MPMIDIHKAAARTYDACIVGSGPAGTATAMAMSEAGKAVLLIDAGDMAPAPGPSAERSVPRAHSPLDETNCRAFGGTSWLWGGRIMPLSEPELRRHDWPVDYETVARHFEEAAALLGGSSIDRPFLQPDKTKPFDLNAVEMLGPDGPVSERFRDRLEAATGPDILLSTVVVGLILVSEATNTPYCSGVRVRHGSENAIRELKAGVTVVASGGVETARLLLADQARHPDTLGHLQALGVGYSGHLTGSVSRITFPTKTDPREYGWRPRKTGEFVRRVFRSTAVGVAEEANMFFWAKNWPPENAIHGSGILSAKHLVSRALGRGGPPKADGPGVPDQLRPTSMMSHVKNMFTDAPTSFRALPDLFRATTNRSRRSLDHLIPNRANSFRLCYHAEQERNLDNRIELAGPVSHDELPDIRIHYDYSDRDVDAVLRGHALLEKELKASGLAEMVYDNGKDDLRDIVRQKARDGYHQIGTARMGRDPQDSVVDGDCRMHGLNGVYLAGSSVFRSSGAALPTQTIVALALRLADHLCADMDGDSEPKTKAGDQLK
ncbi:GMC oxidoreductase [Yoonia maritima]|uniref:GMC oxidoreductase n=1 Tax=Yoonia maritima TaxID=1435347 RepID=UPI0037369D5E